MLKVLIVYESMFGATRRVAEALGRGAAAAAPEGSQVTVRRVTDVTPDEVAAADILALGAPTHVHSLSRPATRTSAMTWSEDPNQNLTLEPGALGPGVRELLKDFPPTGAAFLAFGTRADGPEIFTGSAARAIRKRLRKKGLQQLTGAQDFEVDTGSRLLEGEERRAEELGRTLLEGARHTLGVSAS